MKYINFWCFKIEVEDRYQESKRNKKAAKVYESLCLVFLEVDKILINSRNPVFVDNQQGCGLKKYLCT
jgi:hypothetical protein